jgi:hypothetical protein
MNKMIFNHFVIFVRFFFIVDLRRLNVRELWSDRRKRSLVFVLCFVLAATPAVHNYSPKNSPDYLSTPNHLPFFIQMLKQASTR